MRTSCGPTPKSLEVGKRQVFARNTLGTGRIVAKRINAGGGDVEGWVPYGSVTLGYRF
jgi:hypothetical protein